MKNFIVSFVSLTSRLKARLHSLSNQDYLFAIVLMVTTLLAYQPAWNGKPILDDAWHLITPEFRPVSGLARLWINPKTTQQYHPLVDTLFWVEDKLWGESMLGYHIVNILLHVVATLLLLKILQRLGVAGAWLAAAIFALHPVQVESVAFLVELKNTLSAIFFFGGVLAYLRFDEKRDWKCYFLVSFLVLVGLFAKTVVAMLPAAVLIVLWWKRGRLEWKRDVVPLIPFVILGILAGTCTAWMEREFSGAKGQGFDFSMSDRCLIAGRAFWFYLSKIFWPSNLVLIYPRWKIDSTVWWQYLFPIAAIFLVAVAWTVRRRWRWPLAGLLFFTVMLLPVLGFFNVLLFSFHFVSDHFQYLPIIGIISPLSAGVATVLSRSRGWHRTVGYGLCLALLATLASLTWQHSWMFQDSETCYRTVLKTNPGAWAAQFNVGSAVLKKGRLDEAIPYFQKTLELNPGKPRVATAVHVNLGHILIKKGQFDEAIIQYKKMLEIEPDYRAYNGLGSAFHKMGKFREAIANYEKALELEPNSALAQSNLAWMLATAPEASLRNGPKALELAQQADHLASGNDPLFLHSLAAAYAETGQFSKAVATAQRAFQQASDRKIGSLINTLRIETGLYEIRLPYRETTRD